MLDVRLDAGASQGMHPGGLDCLSSTTVYLPSQKRFFDVDEITAKLSPWSLSIDS
jgi:hypothetical protein